MRRSCAPGTVVSDVGSTKKQIMRRSGGAHACRRLVYRRPPDDRIRTIRRRSRDPLLFSERAVFALPYPDTPPEALLTMLNLVEDLMAFPVTIDAEEHDRIMAMISHVPQLIAVALMHAAQEQDVTHKCLIRLWDAVSWT